MCWATINNFVDRQIEDLRRSGDRRLIEGKLFRFAAEANERQPGALDNPACSMKGWPLDLRGVKKYRIGRHRVFYTGSHHQCEYRVIYIKKFKKDDKEGEHDPRLHDKLRRRLNEPDARRLLSDDPNGES